MQLTEDTRGGWRIVTVAGRVDNVAAETLKQALGQAVTNYRQVAVDCSGIEYLSSAGLGALVDGAATARVSGHRFSICAPSPRVDLLFKLSKLDTQLTIESALPV